MDQRTRSPDGELGGRLPGHEADGHVLPADVLVIDMGPCSKQALCQMHPCGWSFKPDELALLLIVLLGNGNLEFVMAMQELKWMGKCCPQMLR